MKNYYEILEVDKNASQEVIEKAYKTLAKKYHPDLQQGDKKYEYAEKLKIINQAYDVLSDSFKKAEYDQQLQDEIISLKEQEQILQENYDLRRRIEAAERQAYNDAYIQDLKSRGYKIRYKHDLKYYIKLVIMLTTTIFVCFLIYQIPVVKKFFINLYKENIIFQSIIDIFKNTFSAGF